MHRAKIIVKKPTLDGVLLAEREVALVVSPTPLFEFEAQGRTIFAKAESLQPMGAFKLRGAWHRLSALSDEERSRGVVAFSSGNHAQGVAWAAKRLGISAAIVMPSDAPVAKLAGTRALGAEIILYNREIESREGIAADLADRSGATLVPSFDDPWIIEGQGSAGIEAAAQMSARGRGMPDLIVTPCGGGGLAAGLALSSPDARVMIVEPQHWDDMGRSLALGYIVEVAPDAVATSCDALMCRRVSDLTFQILRATGATGMAVSETEIEAAIYYAFSRLHIVLEPGGAVALAAILSGKVIVTDNTLVILSGGNIDPSSFAAILARSGTLA
jgi:threonine dehydratase